MKIFVILIFLPLFVFADSVFDAELKVQQNKIVEAIKTQLNEPNVCVVESQTECDGKSVPSFGFVKQANGSFLPEPVKYYGYCFVSGDYCDINTTAGWVVMIDGSFDKLLVRQRFEEN